MLVINTYQVFIEYTKMKIQNLQLFQITKKNIIGIHYLNFNIQKEKKKNAQHLEQPRNTYCVT